MSLMRIKIGSPGSACSYLVSVDQGRPHPLSGSARQAVPIPPVEGVSGRIDVVAAHGFDVLRFGADVRGGIAKRDRLRRSSNGRSCAGRHRHDGRGEGDA